ncbi:MAG: acetyl-CoA carboxylase biotin carboxyl carrier protein [Pseudomonadales bacterium]
MDLRKIKKLIELVEESGLSELEVRSGEESVRIARPVGPAVGAPAAATGAPGATAAADGPGAPVAAHTVTAPLTGVFYASPEPGAQPFAAPGQAVAAGDVLCIIESMKMMNEVRSDRAGVVAEVCVANGTAVSAGQPLFRLR